MRVAFPRKGWVYDLVDGRAFGCAEHVIPFVSSDEAGDWHIEAENMLDVKSVRKATLRLGNEGSR